MIKCAQGVLGTHTNLPALLQLFFRDDLSAWAVKRSGGRGGGGPALPREQLKQLCAANADACLQRLRTVRTPCPFYEPLKQIFAGAMQQLLGCKQCCSCSRFMQTCPKG